MEPRRFWKALAAVLFGAALLGCGGSDDSAPQPNLSSRIHLLTAASGELAPAGSAEAGAARLLTLRGLAPEAQWYTDRPGRETGATAVQAYVNEDWRDAYGDIPPNATLRLRLPGRPGLDGLYVSLSNPAYDARSGSLSFRAELLADTIGEDVAGTLAFTDVTLNVLDNAEDGKEVSSYVQYAAQASLLPTETPHRYRVVLSGAGPDMFWVDNAPGRYSDSRPMSYFFPQWPYVFGDAPPNAALFGTTAAGDFRLHFLTLTEPAYDEARGELAYTATLLDQSEGVLEPLRQVVLSIDSGAFSRFPLPGKGVGYQAFSSGYDPSTANGSYLYFGSDIARRQMGALWGTESHLSQGCGQSCRNDLQTMKDLGINLIRLYDWDPRNDHSQFLDYADKLHLKVVVPISNWLPMQPAHVWDTALPDYFRYGNFGNRDGTDWHPAVAGVIISNELDMEQNGAHYSNVIGLIARFLEEADKRRFSKSVLVGAPIAFVPRGEPLGPQRTNMPGWNQFHRLVSDPRTAPYKDRLMLAANTYNSREYLFDDAESTGRGWVPLTYEQFGVPILFTEIGKTRAHGDFTPDFVRRQLQGVLEYQRQHPEQMLGALHFQFANKVWKQTPDDRDSEGAFGMFRHGTERLRIVTTRADYDFDVYEAGTNYGTLIIDELVPTPTWDAVVQAYR